MSNYMVSAFIQNAALLLSMVLIFDLISSRLNNINQTWKKIATGVLLGIITIMVMSSPWFNGHGLRTDTRSVILSVSGWFFGPIPTIIAMVLSIGYRIYLGGAYVTGIVLIVISGTVGILWPILIKNARNLNRVSWNQLLLFGVIIHILMDLVVFTQPLEIAIPFFKTVAIPNLLIGSVSTLLIGLLMTNRASRNNVFHENLMIQQGLKSLVSILQIPTSTMQDYFNLALDEAIKITQSKNGVIYAFSDQLKEFSLIATSTNYGENEQFNKPPNKVPLEHSLLMKEVINDGGPILLNSIREDHPINSKYSVHNLIKRTIYVPIRSNNKIVAIIGVINKPTDYDENDINQLTILMELVWKTREREQAIENLRLSEENYRNLFDQSTDGIFLADEKQNLIDVNPSGLAMFGVTFEELKQILQREEVKNDHFSIPENIDLHEGSEVLITERQFLRRNGELISLEIHTRILPDGRILKIARDITERKKAEEIVLKTQEELKTLLKISDDSRKALLSVVEDQKIIEEALRESEEKYRTLFENISQGFALHEVIKDSSGKPIDYRFIVINPAYEYLTGLKGSDIIGKTVREVLPGVEQNWIDTFGQVATSGISNHFEDYTATLDKYYDVIAFSPKKDFFAVVISDITSRKKADAEIQKLNLELEERVKKRTAQLERANKELESFSYSVSHDLRAPLRSINGFSQIILEEFAENFDPELKRYFQMIQNNSTMMGRLVDDLLNFSRLGRQELKKIKVDPKIIVREVIENMQIDLVNQKINFIINDLPECKADPGLLKQVFVNLISNAVKFSRDQENPVVEIGFTRSIPYNLKKDSQKEVYCYYVKDNGVGFDMKFYDKLFGVFQRLHRSDEFEGTGVGLAIVNRIVTKHGGQVWANSILGKETTFFFTLQGEKDGKRIG